MKNKILLSITSIGFLFSGCSVMPYHNNFICQGGSNIHICKRVSDIYQDSESDKLEKEMNYKQVIKKEQNKNNQNILFKRKLEWVKRENKELKDIVRAISYNKLNNPEEIVLIKDKKVLNKNRVFFIKRFVRICVLNANIRQYPTCKSRVVKVLHKGEKIYAFYLKGAWIKTKYGFIHKSLVCNECKEKKK